MGRGGHDLPLRHHIDGVDVVDAFGPAGGVALMHGVDPQKAGAALGVGLAALANGHRGGPGLDVAQTAFAIARLLAQVVQVGHGNRGQARVLRLAVMLVLALQNAPRGRSAQVLVRLIDPGQQFDIGPRIALGKTMAPVGQDFDPAATAVARDQARHLGPAQSGHLGQVAAHQTSRRAPLLVVLLLA